MRSKAFIEIHAAKALSMACKIEAVSNLKFLRLLPGSESNLIGWLSKMIELLLIEVFFTFHMVTPEWKAKECEKVDRLSVLQIIENTFETSD